MTARIDTLFRQFQLGSRSMRNRIVMAPMTRSHAPGGIPNEAMAAYYRRRAEGGVGLIITEGVIVDHPGASGYPDVPGITDERAIRGWKNIVEAVHAAGALIAPQLWHVGSIRQCGMKPHPEVGGFAPSAIRHPAQGPGAEAPREMSHADIEAVIGSFARAAASAKMAGFDALEIHGAHGYLVDQFLWEKTNLRTDDYGGSLSRRLRFPVELVRAVRRAVGPGFPIIFRFSQWKQGAYRAKPARTPNELEEILGPLGDAGVDIFHASTRKYWKAEFPGSPLNLAGWAQKLSGKPAITVGSIGLNRDFLSAFVGKSAGTAPIENLLERMEAGEFELAAVGRGLIADPDWPVKVREGRISELIPFTPSCLENSV